MQSITLSLLSGLLAATASLCGKFSMAAEQTLCHTTLQFFSEGKDADPTFYSPLCENAVVFARIGFFISMILCNALMWTVFTKALRMSSTTLEATITNTAANFFFTAIYGQVFFGESLTLVWWLGTALIITGLLLMQRSSQNSTAAESKYRRKRR